MITAIDYKTHDLQDLIWYTRMISIKNGITFSSCTTVVIAHIQKLIHVITVTIHFTGGLTLHISYTYQ